MAPSISGPNNANEQKKSANIGGGKAPGPKMGRKAITRMEHCPLDQRLSLRSKGQLWPDTLPYTSCVQYFFLPPSKLWRQSKWVTGNSRPILPIIVHPGRQGLYRGSLRNKQENIWELFPNWRPPPSHWWIQNAWKSLDIGVYFVYLCSFQLNVIQTGVLKRVWASDSRIVKLGFAALRVR